MNNQNMSREAFLQYINEVSFSAYDTLLFLDTHPDDQDALEYYREFTQKRREALSEYGRMYGPLIADCDYATSNNSWQWMQQPWPWEGGAC